MRRLRLVPGVGHGLRRLRRLPGDVAGGLLDVARLGLDGLGVERVRQGVVRGRLGRGLHREHVLRAELAEAVGEGIVFLGQGQGQGMGHGQFTALETTP